MSSSFNTECSLGSYLAWGRCHDAARSDFPSDNWTAIGNGGTFAGEVSPNGTNGNMQTAIVDNAFKVETVSDALRQQGTAFWGDMQKWSVAVAIGFGSAAVGLGYLSHRAFERGKDTEANFLLTAAGVCGSIAILAGGRSQAAHHEQVRWSDTPVIKFSEDRKSLGSASFQEIYTRNLKWTKQNRDGVMTSTEVRGVYDKAFDTTVQQYKNVDSLDRRFFVNNPLDSRMYEYAHDGKASDDSALGKMTQMYATVNTAHQQDLTRIDSITSQRDGELGEVYREYRRCRSSAYSRYASDRFWQTPFRYRLERGDGIPSRVVGDLWNLHLDHRLANNMAERLTDCEVFRIKASDHIRDNYRPQLSAAETQLKQTLLRNNNSDVANLLNALKRR